VLTVRLFSRSSVALWLLIVGLAIAPVVAEGTGNGYFISVLTRIVIYGLAALSLDFILGFGGLVSLGHAAFFGIGAYVAAILSFHVYENTPVIFGIPGSNEALIVWPLAMLAAGIFAAGVLGVFAHPRGLFHHDHPGVRADAVLFRHLA